MSAPLFSSSVEEVLINDAFNSTMLGDLLLGVYTVVYLGTVYVYARKKSSKSWLVIAAISLSFLAYAILCSVQWYLCKAAFINYGSSPDSVFSTLYIDSWNNWAIYITNVCSFIIAALADGLLIWRCFIVWDCSFRAISLPLVLLFCEIGVDLSVIIIFPVTDFNPSVSQSYTLDILIGISFFVTFATTLVCTTLIAYRIHAASRQEVLQGTRKRVSHIIEMLVQSAAAYSVAAFGAAVVAVFPQTVGNFEVLNGASDYLSVLYFFISGIAPTIMVARVALAADTDANTTAITHISGLQFRSAAPNDTQSTSESIDLAPVEPKLLEDDEKLEWVQEGMLGMA